MKKWYVIVISIFLFMIATITFAVTPIKLIVMGKEIQTESPIQVVNGMIMVPLQPVAEALGIIGVRWDKKSNKVYVGPEFPQKILASIPDKNIILYGREVIDHYQSMILTIKDKELYFDWDNSTMRPPKLIMDDINRDGKEELIVLLITDHGTGYLQTEAHVIDVESLAEIYVDSPLAITLKNVTTKTTEKTIDITVGDQRHVLTKPDYFTGSAEVNLKDIISFDVVNHKLTATIYPKLEHLILGDIKITYHLKDVMYQAKTIQYIKPQ